MDKRFRVLEPFGYTKDGLMISYNVGDIGDVFFFYNIHEGLVKAGMIEEILPIKTQNLSESDSILDYEKKYNMWDATHLMKNHDVKMIDSKFNYDWSYNTAYKTLFTENKYGEEYFIEDLFNESFGYIDSLDLTFTLIKLVEEVKEKWVEISCPKELCNAISNGKMIRFGNDVPMEKYNDKQITTLFGTLNQGIVKIEYLEEN